MDRTLSLSEAKIKLNGLIDDVVTKGDEFIITKNGSPAAVIVPTSLYEGWRETREILSDDEFLADIQSGLKRLKNKSKRHSFRNVFGEDL